METPESKEEILERRREIEEELREMLEETNSPFTLENIKDVVYYEVEDGDMMKIVVIFDTGKGDVELSTILELATDAWNYFPHKALSGLSPMEMILKSQQNQSNQK